MFSIQTPKARPFSLEDKNSTILSKKVQAPLEYHQTGKYIISLKILRVEFRK